MLSHILGWKERGSHLATCSYCGTVCPTLDATDGDDAQIQAPIHRLRAEAIACRATRTSPWSHVTQNETSFPSRLDLRGACSREYGLVLLLWSLGKTCFKN